MRRVRANTDIAAWRIVDGEAVIVHAVSSAYYGLNATATFIWESIVNAPLTADDLASRVGSRYGLAENAVRDEVDAFLLQLEGEGLLSDASSATANGVAAPTSGGDEFVPPRLSRFGELEQLVLSGE